MASSADRLAFARHLERNVDLILLAVIIFAVAGATIFVMSVTIGDWEFWADWKDRRFWPLVPVAALLVFPAGLAAAFWSRFRLPVSCTAVVLLYTLLRWVSVYLNFHLFGGYPLSFVWPSVFIPLAIIVDCTLLITRSVFLTGLIGAFLWGLLVYPANWPLLAAFHEPIMFNGEMLTTADLLGFEYIRTGLPEYVRQVERSLLRTFGDAVTPLTAVFAGFVCTLVFYVSWAVGLLLNNQAWIKKI
ncbi:MAG: methane monooxygenase/ammonia monooxygenase subunit A [Proteobacteria bacterium]|nr:MAG: methane monooxygenase/ammonia monooxygenase subunit A [Pseudomonadota bacterium]